MNQVEANLGSNIYVQDPQNLKSEITEFNQPIQTTLNT